MSLTLKVVAAAALAAVAVWTASNVPVTPPPTAGEPWAAAPLDGLEVADTLSLASALGQMVGAPDDAPNLDRLISAGRVGRIEVAGGSTADHLGRVYAWQEAAPFPVLLSTPSRSLGLPLSDVPSPATLPALEAASVPDLGYLSGVALGQASRSLALQSPGTPILLGDESRTAVGSTTVTRALVRGLRSEQRLPTARLLRGGSLEGLASLSQAGLMELRLPVSAAPDAGQIQSVKDEGVFTGLIVAEVDADASGAVEAAAAGADVVQSSRPDVVFDSLAQGARDGRISAVRWRDASRRVLSAKVWSGLDLAPPPPPSTPEGVAARTVQIRTWRPLTQAFAHRSRLLSDDIVRRSITVLQDEDGPLPLVGPDVPRSVFTVVLDPGASQDRPLPFVNELATALPPSRSSHVRLGLGLDQSRYQDALEAAAQADVVVIAAYPDEDDLLASRHFALADQLLRRAERAVFVALGPTVLATGLPPSRATVLAYEDSETAQRSAAHAIAGQLEVAGRLPTSIAGRATVGDGVRLRQQALRLGSPEEVGLRASAAERVDGVLEDAVRNGAFPGGAVAVGRDGVLLRLEGYGRLTRGGASATPTTPYDLASLTKVVGTTTAAMQLVEAGRLDLDEEVVEYLPRYTGLGKEFVTVRQLLEHSAGHRAWYPFHANDRLDRAAALDFIYADTLRYPPGTRSRYSDFDMIVLGEVLEVVSDMPLDQLLTQQIFEPLGMDDTGYRDVGVVDPRAAPTETDAFWRGRTMQGEVHDEAASVFGGVAGHAGLFSTAADLSRFAFVLANGGSGYGVRLFRRTTLDRFTQHVRLPSTYPTGLGWMVNAGRGNSSAGSLSSRSFGHTGFTGTSIWVDPESRLFVVLLTNRVHPSRRNRRIRDVRTSLADAVAGAVQAPLGRPYLALGFGPVPDDLASL